MIYQNHPTSISDEPKPQPQRPLSAPSGLQVLKRLRCQLMSVLILVRVPPKLRPKRSRQPRYTPVRSR